MLRDRRGAIGVVAALSLPIVLAFAALVIDYGYLVTIRNELQASADASSLAAVRELPSTANTVSKAKAYAAVNMPAGKNGQVLADADVVPGNWLPPLRTFTPGGSPTNAVRVVTRRATANNNPVPAFFAKAVGISDFDVNTPAVATVGGGPGMSCILALNETEDQTLNVFGNADVEAVGCNVQVNSCAATDAMWAHGGPTVHTSGDDDSNGYINVCGGYRENGPVDVDPEPYHDNGVVERDPFADWDPGLRVSDPADCNYTNFSFSDSVTLDPGVYCGGITGTGSGTVTFNPGVYVIQDGPLDIGGTLAVEGNDVGFYMTGADANVNFKGTADVTLSASATGPLAGFLFFGDKNNPATSPHVFRGTPVGGYEGIIYLPEADFQMKGTATGGGNPASDCLVLIADTLYFNGTTDTGIQVNNECSKYQGTDAFTQTLYYRLVD